MQAGLFHARNLAKVLTEVRDAGGLEKLDLIAVTRGFLISEERTDDIRAGVTDVSRRRIEYWYPQSQTQSKS
jgi:hypothetical protein